MMSKKKEKIEQAYEPISEEEDKRLEKKGKPAQIRSAPEGQRMSYFALRLDNETLRALQEIAQREGVGTSIVARRILREGVKQLGHETSFETKAKLTMEEMREIINYILMNGYSPAGNSMSVPEAFVFERSIDFYPVPKDLEKGE